MKLADAQTAARELTHFLSPVCERVEYAGSVRRGVAEPKDLELVCVPKIISVERTKEQPGLFDSATERAMSNLLDAQIETWLANGIAQPRLPRARPQAALR